MRNTIIRTRPVNSQISLAVRHACRRAPLAALACICTAASAQEARGVLEEIIVTAQKREQSIQDVGISISALTGDQMRAFGFQGSTDLARMTPGVYLGGSIGGQTAIFTIRGVTQNDFNDWVEAPVAVYIDDAYIAMAQGQSFSTFDVERVEVAKGPQGTLFGRNATGGLIHYLTRKPSREFDAYVELTGAEYGQFRAEAAVGGPLGGRLAGRLSALYNTYGEIFDNRYPEGLSGQPPVAGQGEDEWNDDTTAVRGQLSFDASDDVNVLLSASYAKTDTSTGPYQSTPTVAEFDGQGRVINTINAAPGETREAIGPGGVGIDIPAIDGDFDGLRPVPGGDLFGYIDSDGEDFDVSKNIAYTELNEFETTGAGLKLSWDLGDAEFTSLSDFKSFEKFVNMDVDAAPYAQSMFIAQADVDTFTQEFRLNGATDRMSWVAGFYYLQIDNETNNGLSFEANSPFSSPIIFGVPVDTVGHVKLDTDSYSLFGQVDFALTDRWTLVAGARAIREEKDFRFEQAAYLNEDDRFIDTLFLFPFPETSADTDPSTSYAEDTSDDLWAGKLQLEYRPGDGLLLYGGVNRGVKAGSFNAQLVDGSPRLAPADMGYEPESLLAYEVGFKSTLMDGRARLNGAAYFYDYDDYQAFVFVQSSGTVSNLQSESKGVELDFTVTPVDGLDIQLGASYFDATVEDLALSSATPGVEPLLKDVEPSFAPPLQLAALLRYAWPALGGELSAQIDGSYTDSFYHNLRNFDSEKYDDYVLGNLRFGYAPDGGNWELAAFVKNFTDERYRTIGFDLATLCGCNEDAYGAPRWAGLTVKIKFD
jgi:iron complex outermembrane receptor protein